MNIQSYLAFDGNCQEALSFYGDLFNAGIKNRQTYEDKKIDVPASYRKKLQHAEIKGKGVHFMAYDSAPDTPLTNGNQMHMSIDLKEKDRAESLFEALAAQGITHHQFRERSWGYFGRCTDRFGVNWMVNYTP